MISSKELHLAGIRIDDRGDDLDSNFTLSEAGPEVDPGTRLALRLGLDVATEQLEGAGHDQFREGAVPPLMECPVQHERL
jgi:hypothetical protein